jgi:hypothetical protein
MFIKIKGHLVNLFNVNHIEEDDGDIGVWFHDGSHIVICYVNWKKLTKKLKRFSSLLRSTSEK